jgi:hypothetical protein
MTSRLMAKGKARSILAKALRIGSLVLPLLQAGASAEPGAGFVTAGTWGGEHLILEVSGKGAEAEFDCARGEVTQPLRLDGRDDFDVAGTFTPEHGGPVLRNENAQSAAARYLGHVDGDTMTLTISLGGKRVGVFALRRGSHPMLRKWR